MTTVSDLSAAEQAALIRDGRLRPSSLMEQTLERIRAWNGSVNAIVSLRPNADLLAEARALDAAPISGPLHGLPIAVKDLVAVRGIRTTWGSPIYADHVPKADDLVAARMRAAGAILIGKTNTPEWGHGSHTFNPVFGATRNPYDLNRTAGGSSGGAAAALACRMVALADGSDAMGSLRNPAAFCNVYGFRPSFGLVPGMAQGDSFLSTVATEGPMARTVEDVALLLEVLSGPNPEVPFGREGAPFSRRLEIDLRGLRIGWLGDWGGAYGCEPGILDHCEAGLRVLEDLGAVVEPLPPPFPAEQLWQSWLTIRAMLNAGDKQALYADPARRALLKPESLWEIEQGQTVTAAEVHAASVIRPRWYARAARLFSDHDALVMPSAQVWPFPVEWRWPQEINGRAMDTYHRWMEVVIPVSLAGLPSLNLPVGFGPQGLPMGMQLFGAYGQDAKVLAIGQQYHRATDWPGQRPPQISG
jgi:amidase